MATLHANDLRDVIQDAERNRATWVVMACRRFGFEQEGKVSNMPYSGMIAGAYVILFNLVGVGFAPLYALLTLLTFAPCI